MKKGCFLTWLLGTAVLIPACTRHQELEKDWQRYEPTPFYREYARPAPAREIAPIPRNPDFEKEIAFKRHILTKKTTKNKRQLRGTAGVHATNKASVLAMMPYAS